MSELSDELPTSTINRRRLARVESIRGWVEEACNRVGSEAEFCRVSGADPSVISRFVSGETEKPQNPNLRNMELAAREILARPAGPQANELSTRQVRTADELDAEIEERSTDMLINGLDSNALSGVTVGVFSPDGLLLKWAAERLQPLPGALLRFDAEAPAEDEEDPRLPFECQLTIKPMRHSVLEVIHDSNDLASWHSLSPYCYMSLFGAKQAAQALLDSEQEDDLLVLQGFRMNAKPDVCIFRYVRGGTSTVPPYKLGDALALEGPDREDRVREQLANITEVLNGKSLVSLGKSYRRESLQQMLGALKTEQGGDLKVTHYDTTRTSTTLSHLRDGLLQDDVFVVGGAQHYWASKDWRGVELLATGKDLRKAKGILKAPKPFISDGRFNPNIMVVRRSAVPCEDERNLMARYLHVIGKSLKQYVDTQGDPSSLMEELKLRSHQSGGVQFQNKERLSEYVKSGLMLDNDSVGRFVPLKDLSLDTGPTIPRPTDVPADGTSNPSTSESGNSAPRGLSTPGV